MGCPIFNSPKGEKSQMDFLGIGPIEFILVLFVAFIFLGPTGITQVARSIGKFVREVRYITADIPSALALDEPLDQPTPIDKDEQPSQDANLKDETDSKDQNAG